MGPVLTTTQEEMLTYLSIRELVEVTGIGWTPAQKARRRQGITPETVVGHLLPRATRLINWQTSL